MTRCETLIINADKGVPDSNAIQRCDARQDATPTTHLLCVLAWPGWQWENVLPENNFTFNLT